jgi:hypothetical protein
MANAETHVACTNGNQIEYFNLKGVHLLTHRLKYKPDYFPEISYGKILYSLNSQFIVVENIRDIFRIEKPFCETSAELLPIKIENKVDFIPQPRWQAPLENYFNYKDHFFKDVYLGLIRINNDRKEFIFTAFGKQDLEKSDTTLWKYDIQKKDLKILSNESDILNSVFIDDKIIYSNYMDLYVIDPLKGSEKITQQIWAERDNSFINIKKGQLYLIKNIKDKLLLTLHEFNDGRNLIGMVELDLTNKKVRNVMKFDYFKHDFYFNTTIKDITEDFRYILLKNRVKNVVLLVDLIGNKEYVISNNMDENASFITCLPNEIY